MTRIDEVRNHLVTIYEKVARLENYVANFDSANTSISRLKARQEILEGVRKEFEETQYELETIDNKAESRAKYREDRIEFENKYCDLMGDIMDIIQNSENKNLLNCTTTASNFANKESLPNLPILNLKTFSGNYKDWTNFENCFKSVIDENSSLNNRQKLQYLKSCLRDEALRAIESLTIEDENYGKSWDILEKRFKNTRLIVRDHVMSMINAPVVTKSSYSSLRELLDTIITNIAALKTLKIPVEAWDALIVPIITEKLDFCSKREWQSSLNNSIPTFSQLIQFLEKRVMVLESIDSIKPANQTLCQKSAVNNNKRTVTNVATNIKSPLCYFCKNSQHSIRNCSEFLDLDIQNRIEKVKLLKLCSNCLRNNHTNSTCRITTKCRICNKKHHSLLHIVENLNETQNQDNLVTTISQHSSSKSLSVDSILLATAIVLIKNRKNQYIPCRVLLDPGSMSNCITKSMCEKLNLKRFTENIEIKGLNGTTSIAKESILVDIKSKYNPFVANQLKCIVVEKITENLPLVTVKPSMLEIPVNIQLADPTFYESSGIDMLLGSGLFWSLLCIGQVVLQSGLVLQKTHLGFIVGGPYQVQESSNFPVIKSTMCNLASCTENSLALEEKVAKFFELEMTGIEPTKIQILTPEEANCEDHFSINTIRDANGRFVIKLPAKNNHINVGESKNLATKRFLNLERKYSKDENFKINYSNFIHEYLVLGHMERINNIPGKHLYLPHHAVFKESSTTTKLRVVFDASAKTSNGYSLNDNLMCGPVIQRDLFSILLEFRTFQYALNADITKMYRQIRVTDEDANYQLIVWRNNTSEPIQTYRLTTLTYGTKPASFIATRCLKELAAVNSEKYPRASHAIQNHFYMDDLLTGANSVSEVIDLKRNIILILTQSQFELRKFHSNNKAILAENSNENSNSKVDLNKNEQTKILGLAWNPKTDALHFELNLNETPKKVTKRIMLSISAQIFDPLGLIGPVLMKAKILLQQLWSLKLGWDESVPMSIHTSWTTFLRELKNLKYATIPRKVISSACIVMTEFHGFSDASLQGYGAAIYLRILNNEGNYDVNLMCAKSRVAPLKTITLPRLELCGALLLSRLIKKVRQNLEINCSREYLWTDSSIVLAWINTPTNSLKTFVSHRIAEITSLTEVKDWRHVRSEHNAADILSRGAYPSDIIQNSVWYNGPDFLKLPEAQWPVSHLNINHTQLPEIKNPTVICNTASVTIEFLSRYSQFYKLQRIVAWIIRFKNNCKNRDKNLNSTLSINELNNAMTTIIIIVQQFEFNTDWHRLKENKPLPNGSKLLSLNPFMDEQKIIRVGGRLRNAHINNDVKFPILLPKNHFITKLLIKQEHERHLHAGPQATLAALRQRYWIMSARSAIRQVLHYCHPCFKIKPTESKFKMGDLPAPRVKPARPFLTTGIDYAGPIQVKESRGRGKRLIKAYIVLFICFATKAIHMEMVTDLTTEEFLNAFRRFISRRGCPHDIHSDNGTNFIGAKNELKELYTFINEQDKFFMTELAKSNVKWHLIPPRSPHMGGLWEANIKSMKSHLKKVVGNSHLTCNEMYTLLVRIEACLNSRPLMPLNSDPNDLQVLTPGHFLIGEPLTTLPEYDLKEVPLNRLSRWQLVERLRSHYWLRWSREYLTSLQNRSKWVHAVDNQQLLGAVVILIEDNLPPLSWKIGRICDIHPGDDGQVRVVSVKTAQGIVKRATRKVAILPMEDN